MHTTASVLGDRLLMSAFALSLSVHALILAVRFVDPEVLRWRQVASSLEVVLVNARSETAPTRAEALAQANLDGGGPHDEGRRSSPLPNAFQAADGDTLEMARRTVQQLEEEQRRLLAQLQASERALSTPHRDREAKLAERGSAEELRQALARQQAIIEKAISDYQKRPRKHFFMPSTSEDRFARYVEDWRVRVEKIGNENYPEEARGKIYGSLRLTVAIRKDGSLVDAIIEQSSGSPVLDRAARRIVKLAAPYPPFPPEIARDTDILEITRTWVFTNDQLATRAAGAPAGDRP
ncbi:MAG: TonB family protein [Sutterellaceae bacterium]|nr:TonB family protein [Burkholderiaceae bacterium]MCX7902015.1 TonB family protein [Burkholderiaceae bacterium]MDW8429620.1 TonB family protein [Sutterellaceae bacterium]